MTIECRCPGCGQRFRAADVAAGRRVKCPRCAVVIQLPGPSKAAPTSPPAARKPAGEPPPTPGQFAWFVRTADQQQHGPLDKTQLDRLVAERRLDAFCEVRRADWDQWRLIEDVYPSLAMDGGEDGLLTADVDSDLPATYNVKGPSRVRPCPDCEQTVSRRATQCPHCGCPLAGELPPPPVRPPPLSRPAGHTGSQRRVFGRVVFLTVATALLIGVVIAGIYLGVRIFNRSGDVATPVQPISQEPPAAPAPAPSAARPSEPVVQALSADAIAKCKENVAAAMARDVDNAYRTRHRMISSIPQLGEFARAMELVEELADPRKKRPEGKEAPKPGPDASQPYQSQFEALCRDCRTYLDTHVKQPVEQEETIWSIGRNWVKMRLPERRILENLLQPGAPLPDTPPLDTP